MGKHFDWSLFSLWSELLSAMTDINSIWTSGCEWEEGEKNTPVTKEEAYSRNVMSNCSQTPLCAPHLHPPSGPDVPVPQKASYRHMVLFCPRSFCVSHFGITESCGKCCLLVQGKAKTIGLHMLQLCPLTWSFLLVLDPGRRDEHISVSFRQLCAAVLRLGKYLSPEFNKIIIAL